MLKKEHLLSISSVVLVGAFIIISILVWLSAGKNAYLIKKKLTIGAAMLSLTGVATGTGCVSCYDPYFPDEEVAQSESIVLEDANIDDVENPIIRGRVVHRENDEFSFRLTDSDGIELQQGAVDALDGAFDSLDESFEITLGVQLETGEYHLFLYTFSADEIDRNSGYWAARFPIHVSE